VDPLERAPGTERPPALTRREVLRRGAVLGAAVWAAPAIARLPAAVGAAGSSPHCGGDDGLASADGLVSPHVVVEPGQGTFAVPARVTAITVEVWGAGGDGSPTPGQGGRGRGAAAVEAGPARTSWTSPTARASVTRSGAVAAGTWQERRGSVQARTRGWWRRPGGRTVWGVRVAPVGRGVSAAASPSAVPAVVAVGTGAAVVVRPAARPGPGRRDPMAATAPATSAVRAAARSTDRVGAATAGTGDKEASTARRVPVVAGAEPAATGPRTARAPTGGCGSRGSRHESSSATRPASCPTGGPAPHPPRRRVGGRDRSHPAGSVCVHDRTAPGGPK